MRILLTSDPTAGHFLEIGLNDRPAVRTDVNENFSWHPGQGSLVLLHGRPSGRGFSLLARELTADKKSELGSRVPSNPLPCGRLNPGHLNFLETFL